MPPRNKTEVAVIPAADYPALTGTKASLVIEALRENLGAGDSMSEFDLERIKMPAGGGLAWTVNTPEGEEAAATIDGIIVHTRNVRAYWRVGLDESGGGTPPDCSSPDAVTGYGDPGGPCATCPFALFGSDPNGRGQACKQMRQMFVLTPDSLLPIVMTLPPTSLKTARQYLIGLASKGHVYRHVVTRFSLERVAGSGTPDYSRIKLTMVDPVMGDMIGVVDEYAASLAPVLEQSAIVTRTATNGSPSTADPVVSALTDDADEF